MERDRRPDQHRDAHRGLSRASRAAIGDHTWARFVLDLQRAFPSYVEFVRGSEITSPIRMVKDADEIAALRVAAEAVDKIALDMRAQPFAGRTELDVHRDLVERMLALGHERGELRDRRGA